MAYNKRNLYNKIVEIQNIVMKGQQKGKSQKEIYYSEIEPKYFISPATFYNYLGTNAKAELVKLENKDKAKKAQLTLAF